MTGDSGSDPSTSSPTGRTPAPWLGRPWEHRHASVAALGSLGACTLYWLATTVWAPTTTPGWVEFAGTATSLWSVWITQKRNVLALPVGIVSVALMGWYFRELGLGGQTWLHWGYYLPVQFWAWAQWTRGGEDAGELTVTTLTPRERGIAFVLLLGLTLLLGQALETLWAGTLHVYWDASIVAASVVAMVLMARKKLESWWLWILPVNVSAIGLYSVTGAYMFAALYVLFLIMACVGLWRWSRAAGDGVP